MTRSLKHMQHAFRELEGRYGGRLGVAVLDTSGRERISYRGDERFALCSTFKLLAAAFVLARVDRNQESLTRLVTFGRDNLVPWSPITEQHAGAAGMTIEMICEAAMTLSDNTAGNLMLDSFGGPTGLTAFLRSLGDGITCLDRREPELNRVEPGDPRDTTTPLAMLELVQKIVLEDVLAVSSREQLIKWLIANKTGDRRLRAGVPIDCTVGARTGTGPRNATNDVGVIWPPSRPPIIATAFYVDADASHIERESVLALVARIAMSNTR
jgi:beta-lactamase class A